MPIATGQSTELGYCIELVPGTVATGEYTLIRRISTQDFGLDKETYDSEEIRLGRSLGDSRHGSRQVNGGIEVEISAESHDPFWLALMGQSAWGAAYGQSILLSVTVAASPANTITRPSGTFLADGFMLGDRVLVSASGATANNGHATIIGISTNGRVLTVDKSLSAYSGTLTLQAYGKRATVGSHLTSFSLERALRGLTAPQYETFYGVSVAGVNVQLQDSGAAQATWLFLGRNSAGMSATSYNTVEGGLAYNEPIQTGVLVSANGMLSVTTSTGVRRLATVTSFDVTIDNGLDSAAIVGSNVRTVVSWGTTQAVSGTITALFENDFLYDVFAEESEASLILCLNSAAVPGEEHVTLTFPRCKFETGDLGDVAAEGLPVEMEFVALLPADSTASQVIVTTATAWEGATTYLPIPVTPPWENPYVPIDVKRLVIVSNSSVTWSYTLCAEYCAHYGIPTANILPIAFGHGGTTAIPPPYWIPSPATVAQVNSTFMLGLKSKCLTIKAQGILLGPACPPTVTVPDELGNTSYPSVATLASMALCFPPDPPNSLSYTFGEGEAGSVTAWKTHNIGAEAVPITFSIDVTGIVNDIRSGDYFVSGGRMNLWLEAKTPFFYGKFESLGGTAPRLTIVQSGGVVYDVTLSVASDDGFEFVGGSWVILSVLQVADSSGTGTGLALSDVVGTLSFPSVTVNPAVAVTLATLTLTSDYGVMTTSGTFRVWGEDQDAEASVAWSTSNKPIGSSAVRTASHTDQSFAADPSKAGSSIFTYLGQDSVWPNYYSEDNASGSGYMYRYPMPFAGAYSVVAPKKSTTEFLGTAAHYDNRFDKKGVYGYPTLPVGRIGMSAAGWNGGLPAAETELLDRNIIDQAIAARDAHDPAAARLRTVLFHAATYPGAPFINVTMYLYSLCRYSWGMTGAVYAYAEGASTATVVSNGYAPWAGGQYTNATLPTDRAFYFLFGNWLNLAPDAPYSPPYSTAWTPLPGAGAISGPSQGWQYCLQALYAGGACVLTDYQHIGGSHLQGHASIFYNLLRGMTWLEATFYGGVAGNVPTGDPLAAPYRKTPWP